MTLDDDEIKLLAAMLAAIERDMDSGQVPYVVNHGHRWPVPKETMEEMGLISGQGVSDYLIRVMLEKNIAYCETQLAIEKARGSNDRGP